MVGQIRILILQDEGEAELLEYELSKFKVPLAAVWVQSLEVYLKSLLEFSPDLIFAGPQISIDRRTALALAQEVCPDVPFIFIGGEAGKESPRGDSEEEAAEAARTEGASEPWLAPWPGADAWASILPEAAEAPPAPGDDRCGPLFQAVGSMVAFLSPECRILEFNRGAERLTGWDRQEVLGKDALELLVPEADRSQAKANLERVLNGAVSRGFDLAIRLRNGGERAITLTCDLLSDPTGQPAGIMVVGRDVTAPKRQPSRPPARMVSAGRNQAFKHRIIIRRTGSC